MVAFAAATIMTIGTVVLTLGAFSVSNAEAATPALPGYVNAQPVGDPPAVYPDEAIEAELTGDAMVQCTIGTDGKASGCAVLNTHGAYDFGRAALNYARGEDFRPATLNGIPVESNHQWKVIFRLN